VHVFQPDSPSIAADHTLILEHAGTRREVRILGVAAHGAAVLVTLDGVADRSAAEALRGATLLVREADLPPPAADEFYDYEVEGFAVETTDGRRLGTIVETLHNGLHGIWTVRDGEREHLIPVIADVVRDLDRAGRLVVVDPLPGLLD
jgi:16S rRNA processing protein RimM